MSQYDALALDGWAQCITHNLHTTYTHARQIYQQLKGNWKYKLIMHKMLDLITNYYNDGPLSYTLGPFSNGPNVMCWH